MKHLNGSWIISVQTRLTSKLKINTVYTRRKVKENDVASPKNSTVACTVNKTLMGHFYMWPCPKIFRRRSVSTVFAADRLELWLVDLPVNKQRQKDQFMNEQKVPSHLLLFL